MLTKERITKVLGSFLGRFFLILIPIICLVIKICDFNFSLNSQEIMVIKEYIVFSPELLQGIWEKQLTVSAAVISICMFFLDNGHKRRLGLSYKYIFFHNDIFGKNNVMYLSCMNMAVLIYEFICVYFILEIKNFSNSQLIQSSLIICLGINIWQNIRLMDLFVVAKYKESVIYDKIRDLVERGGKDSFFTKIKTGVKIDYKLTLENKEYDQYFGDAVFTLFIILKNVDKNDKDLYLDCIAAKIFQYERYFEDKKWTSYINAREFKKRFRDFILEEEKSDKDNDIEKMEMMLKSMVIEDSDYEYINSKVNRIIDDEKERIDRLRKCCIR